MSLAPRSIGVIKTRPETGRTSQALRRVLLAGALLVAAGCSHMPNDALVCRTDGLAGVSYGQQVELASAEVDETTAVGVRYYVVEPTVDISPFEKMLVGVTPSSGRVFSIRLEKHGDAVSLDRDISLVKARVESAYPAIAWRQVGNHHYAENVSDLDLVIFRIGDLKAGRASHMLSYDCDNKQYRQLVIDEARAAGERQ